MRKPVGTRNHSNPAYRPLIVLQVHGSKLSTNQNLLTIHHRIYSEFRGPTSSVPFRISSEGPLHFGPHKSLKRPSIRSEDGAVSVMFDDQLGIVQLREFGKVVAKFLKADVEIAKGVGVAVQR